MVRLFSKATFLSVGGEAGWNCVQSSDATSVINTAYNREETYGGEWTCTASEATAAVLRKTGDEEAEMKLRYGWLSAVGRCRFTPAFYS